MRKQNMNLPPDFYLGCLGQYRHGDPICGRWCALTVRCIIEREQNERFEIIRELISASNFSARMN